MMALLPTKKELLDVSLVAIDQHHKKVITSTVQIADYFGKRHSNIIRILTALSKMGVLKIEPIYYLDQQGRKQKYYELNRDQFLLVVFGFTGIKAVRFKADFIKLFNLYEAELIEWQQGRRIAVDTTKQTNHQIFWLKNALAETIPNSKRCTMLFVHIQQAITKRATGKSNTKRNMMTDCELRKVVELQQQVEIQIEQLKRKGLLAVHIRDEVISMIKAVYMELDYA
jgi:Rha family phage regulatory protein